MCYLLPILFGIIFQSGAASQSLSADGHISALHAAVDLCHFTNARMLFCRKFLIKSSALSVLMYNSNGLEFAMDPEKFCMGVNPIRYY